VLAEHRFGKDRFVVKHFAADVTYMVDGFLDKNRDILHPDLIPAIQSSSDGLVKRLFPRSAGRRRAYSSAGQHGGGAKLFTATVGNQFSKQITDLVQDVTKTGLYFVRCINPNQSKRAGEYTNKYVVEQVRCNGLLEAIRIMREMYGSRVEHQAFFNTYMSAGWQPLTHSNEATIAIYAKIPKAPESLDALREACEQLCQALGLVRTADYQIGRSKVFLRTEQHGVVVMALCDVHKERSSVLQHLQDQKNASETCFALHALATRAAGPPFL
jgi:myosin heavy subunit